MRASDRAQIARYLERRAQVAQNEGTEDGRRHAESCIQIADDVRRGPGIRAIAEEYLDVLEDYRGENDPLVATEMRKRLDAMERAMRAQVAGAPSEAERVVTISIPEEGQLRPEQAKALRYTLRSLIDRSVRPQVRRRTCVE